MEIVRRKKVSRTSLNKKDASAEPRTRRRTLFDGIKSFEYGKI